MTALQTWVEGLLPYIYQQVFENAARWPAKETDKNSNGC